MSQENVEIVRRSNALFNTGDLDAAFELLHPDAEFRDLQNAPDLPEVLHGLDALRLALSHWTDAYDDFGVEVFEYIDADPWVIADVRWHGKGKGSDLLVDVRQADTCKLEDGRIVEWTIGYQDVASALEAVGRSQPQRARQDERDRGG